MGSTEAGAEWTVWLTDDDEVQALNQRFRAHDLTTDVLSFPLGPLPALAGVDAPTLLLGDVFISVEQAARQAPRGELEQELLRLVVHGLCHLRGHDHQRAAAARRMRQEEEALLAAVGVGVGLVARAARAARRALLALALGLVTPLGSGCASSQQRLDTLDAVARARFAACRADVVRQLCPAAAAVGEVASGDGAAGDVDCARQAAALYVAEPPTQRRRWLIDFGCSRAALDGAGRGQGRVE
ncbi:MAG: rRNA maturation RNase YbeY [Proteobacteria bacterium]|nr:rRNA maturation RNase YbeY [Pseudomonadota bacterium]